MLVNCFTLSPVWLRITAAVALTACAVAFPVLKYAIPVQPFAGWPAEAVFAPLILAACALVAAACCCCFAFTCLFNFNEF